MLLFRNITLLCILMFALSCAEKPSGVGCTPNFTGSGMSVLVKQIRASEGNYTYSFELCSDVHPPGAIYSVYGLFNEAEFDTFDPESRVRHRKEGSALYKGNRFEVIFTTHEYFAIYQDKLENGDFVLDKTYEMVRGSLFEAAIGSEARGL